MTRAAGDKRSALAQRLARLGVRDEDLDESFVRSSGPGGQNVNKVASCVVLLHRPTGIVIKCQEDRSQSLNRQRARELLADELEGRIEARRRAEAARLAKLRRQKQRRSRASKEKILAEKRARAEVKRGRGRVRGED